MRLSAMMGIVLGTARSPAAGSSREELPAHRLRSWKLAERFFWTVGVAALSVWAFSGASGAAGARQEMNRFAALRAATRLEATSPDFSLWSPQRIKAWRNAVERQSPAPLAVLRIPRIGLEVPVLEGTDDWTLNRAVGHIADTARPGGDGNSGIAGHRDSFFRGLKDVGPGDTLEIETLERVELYRIERTWVVEPDDVWVLDPTESRSVTLVTCYPFYFIGSAPQRYIVRAALVTEY
jgi:sortase A